MNGGCVDDHINTGNDIFGPLPIENAGTLGGKHAGQIGFLRVRTGDGKTLLQEDFCKAAHTDTADSDKVNVNRLAEI